MALLSGAKATLSTAGHRMSRQRNLINRDDVEQGRPREKLSHKLCCSGVATRICDICLC